MKRDQSQEERIAFAGKIGEVVQTAQPDGRVFERYRRSPGVRLVIVSADQKILMSKEFRTESRLDDLRLPGGKVCDTLEEYHSLLESGADIVEAAKQAAIKEAREETGLEVRTPELIVKAVAGATVEWDLYYFLFRDYEENEHGQQLENGEDIETVWMSTQEIRDAIAAGQMHEWRSVGVLFGKVLPLLNAS
ncbi:NUDIX domain-containing protein [Candidatus Berkelbacteria bacterium]|nr:NUDIX domain-containing protein [Candidatus Berkelbacteria bacterium]